MGFRFTAGTVALCALVLGACSNSNLFETRVGGYCELPKVGKSHAVASHATGLGAHYRIEHPSADHVQITLFVEFTVPADAIGPMSHPGWSQGARGFTQQCLIQAEPYLKGPKGERLSVRLASSDETAKSAFKSQVVITGQEVRGNSLLWYSAWDCPQIVHEVFHFTGLADEYAEPTPYPCRAVGPSDSLMSNPFAAYYAVRSGRRRSLLYPAQFNAVVYPGCKQQNPNFYECSTQAYREVPRESCAEMPIACGAGQTDWVQL